MALSQQYQLLCDSSQRTHTFPSPSQTLHKSLQHKLFKIFSFIQQQPGTKAQDPSEVLLSECTDAQVYLQLIFNQHQYYSSYSKTELSPRPWVPELEQHRAGITRCSSAPGTQLSFTWSAKVRNEDGARQFGTGGVGRTCGRQAGDVTVSGRSTVLESQHHHPWGRTGTMQEHWATPTNSKGSTLTLLFQKRTFNLN